MYPKTNDRGTKSSGDLDKAIFLIFLEDKDSKGTVLPPCKFHHEDLIAALASAETIDKKKLTNIINHIHFKGGHLRVLLQHPHYEEWLLVRAYPEPCLGTELSCRWDRAYVEHKLERYNFQYLIIDHDQSIIVVPVAVLANSSNEFSVKLPDASYFSSARLNPRFACHDVKAELWQNGFQAEGDLMDFSAHAFRIRVQSLPPSSFNWFNSKEQSIVRLLRGSEVYFSGNCSCLQQKQTGRTRDILLTPLQDQIKRFPSKVLRNPRQEPALPLRAVFEHPFSQKKIQRDIFNISSAGFSLCDKSAEVVLIPGMIIPEMNIVYAGILKIRCKTQVIYRKDMAGQVRFGIAILDMEMADYDRLTQLLNNTPGTDPVITSEIDFDELWELFFDSNFIYPNKYQHIQTFRRDFPQTYRKLYENAPEIAKHFNYQQNGRIYSHISMLRAYEHTWMVHHHAARPKDGISTGLVVLKHLIYYLSDMHRLPSANMDYVMCYFRPANKFTDKIYTTFTKELANPLICSLDLFSYLTYTVASKSYLLPPGWSMRECNSSDLWEFDQFYKRHAGGLFCDIMELQPHREEREVEKVYAQIGLVRKWKAFALHYDSELKALIIADESDVFINLCDLLNGFKVFVIDHSLSPDVLFAAIHDLAKKLPLESYPVLIYPDEYAQNNNLNIEKHYCLWILDLQHTNDYMEYLRHKFHQHLI